MTFLDRFFCLVDFFVGWVFLVCCGSGFFVAFFFFKNGEEHTFATYRYAKDAQLLHRQAWNGSLSSKHGYTRGRGPAPQKPAHLPTPTQFLQGYYKQNYRTWLAAKRLLNCISRTEFPARWHVEEQPPRETWESSSTKLQNWAHTHRERGTFFFLLTVTKTTSWHLPSPHI